MDEVPLSRPAVALESMDADLPGRASRVVAARGKRDG